MDFQNCEIDLNSKYEKKLTSIFFCNEISRKLHGYLKFRGIHYQYNLDHQNDETLSKLVLVRIELKQEIDEEASGDEDQDEIQDKVVRKVLNSFRVQNTVSVDSFNNFLTLSEKKASQAFALKDYGMLVQPWELGRKIEQLSLMERVLDEVHQGPWKLQENCGLYYYAQSSVECDSDCEYNYWDIGILTLVENFFSFHVELNDKLIF